MTPRVLVTEGEERSALAAMRGLVRGGYRVSAAACYGPAACHWSRDCQERFFVPEPRRDAAGFVGRLEEILRRGGYAVAIPGTEASLLAMSEARDRLELLTRLGLPPHELVLRSCDKLFLLREAKRVGLAPPETVTCASAEDAAEAADRLGFPLVLKPARSVLEVDGRRQQRIIALVEDEADLLAQAPSFGTPFTLQRFERPRSILSCSGVLADGRPLALTVSRALRTWPPRGGAFCFSRTVEPPPGVLERVSELLRAFEWQGIFQLDLLELDSGRVAAIDFNPRIFASMALDVAAGANVPALWCDWLLGRDPAPVRGRPGVAFRWEEGEVRHLLWQARHRRWRAAAAVLEPQRETAYAYLSLCDPLPILARPVYLVKRTARRRPRRRL